MERLKSMARLRAWRGTLGGLLIATGVATSAAAQAPVTWPELRDRFKASNPSLQAGQIAIDEGKAAEVTAFVRPNPQLSLTLDQIGHTVGGNLFSASAPSFAVTYLRERQDKRELRLESAKGDTTLATSAQADLERTMLFTLRNAFIQVLQAKAFQALAHANLASYDQVLGLGRTRFQAGDISQLDLDRLELQRVSYESDVQTAEVNLRTAKIQLLRLMNDETTPVDQFDVAGVFDFASHGPTLDAVRRLALDSRPDLKAATEAVDKARIDHELAMANGSVDPTITVNAAFPSVSQAWLSYQPPLRQYFGVSVNLPLRIFDSNQGEKQRTSFDITRDQKLAEAARLQVVADVDTAYATVESALALLQPYRDRYLAQATRVRDTVAFSYQTGAASLLDLLQAEQEYRTLQISYVNLVAAYLTAAAQLNLAVGQEVIP